MMSAGRVAWLPDLDDDGVPEALVTESEAPLGERVELRNGATGACSFLQYNRMLRFGSSLSVTVDARYVVAAGGHAGMPEFLHRPA